MPGRLSRTTTAHIATVPIRRSCSFFFFFQAEDGIRDYKVTGVQTCALPISRPSPGERLLEAQLPAAGVLGLQIGVADRETGRVVLKETWLAEAGADGRPDTGPVPEAVDRAQAVSDVGAEALVVFQSHARGQADPGTGVGHGLRIDGGVPARRVDRQRAASAE